MDSVPEWRTRRISAPSRRDSWSDARQSTTSFGVRSRVPDGCSGAGAHIRMQSDAVGWIGIPLSRPPGTRPTTSPSACRAGRTSSVTESQTHTVVLSATTERVIEGRPRTPARPLRSDDRVGHDRADHPPPRAGTRPLSLAVCLLPDPFLDTLSKPPVEPASGGGSGRSARPTSRHACPFLLTSHSARVAVRNCAR